MNAPLDAGDMRYAVAIDTGGTFTDVTLFDRDSGRMWTAKTPSTPADPSIGFMNGIDVLGRDLAGFETLVHGTTIGTNAIQLNFHIDQPGIRIVEQTIVVDVVENKVPYFHQFLWYFQEYLQLPS